VELTGPAALASELVTGVVVGLLGHMTERGVFHAARAFFPSAAPARPLGRSASVGADAAGADGPCYVAFVSGIGIDGAGAAPPALELLLDVLSGAVGDAGLLRIAAAVARVVVGGCVVEPTDEVRLLNKVRLEPSDHARLGDTQRGRLPPGATAAGSGALAMRHADCFLSLLARTVSVDVMPGSTDPTNYFLPQQPLHPVILPATSRQPSARLVTNPYAFATTSSTDTSQPASGSNGAHGGVQFLITSGQNVDDAMKQISVGGSSIECMRRFVDWGLLCPTAPNTLACYPFAGRDPFVVRNAPHVMVACNQPRFETAFDAGTRYVAVPRFTEVPSVVLVDVAHPQFETTVLHLG
jgi:DNA polymerase delta subunit 2